MTTQKAVIFFLSVTAVTMALPKPQLEEGRSEQRKVKYIGFPNSDFVYEDQPIGSEDSQSGLNNKQDQFEASSISFYPIQTNPKDQERVNNENTGTRNCRNKFFDDASQMSKGCITSSEDEISDGIEEILKKLSQQIELIESQLKLDVTKLESSLEEEIKEYEDDLARDETKLNKTTTKNFSPSKEIFPFRFDSLEGNNNKNIKKKEKKTDSHYKEIDKEDEIDYDDVPINLFDTLQEYEASFMSHLESIAKGVDAKSIYHLDKSQMKPENTLGGSQPKRKGRTERDASYISDRRENRGYFDQKPTHYPTYQPPQIYSNNYGKTWLNPQPSNSYLSSTTGVSNPNRNVQILNGEFGNPTGHQGTEQKANEEFEGQRREEVTFDRHQSEGQDFGRYNSQSETDDADYYEQNENGCAGCQGKSEPKPSTRKTINDETVRGTGGGMSYYLGSNDGINSDKNKYLDLRTQKPQTSDSYHETVKGAERTNADTTQQLSIPEGYDNQGPFNYNSNNHDALGDQSQLSTGQISYERRRNDFQFGSYHSSNQRRNPDFNNPQTNREPLLGVQQNQNQQYLLGSQNRPTNINSQSNNNFGQVQTDDVEFDEQKENDQFEMSRENGQEHYDDVQFDNQKDTTGQHQIDISQVSHGYFRESHQIDRAYPQRSYQHQHPTENQYPYKRENHNEGQHHMENVEFEGQTNYDTGIQAERQRNHMEGHQISNRQPNYGGQMQIEDMMQESNEGQREMEGVSFNVDNNEGQHAGNYHMPNQQTTLGHDAGRQFSDNRNQRGQQQEEDVSFESQRYVGQQQMEDVPFREHSINSQHQIGENYRNTHSHNGHVSSTSYKDQRNYGSLNQGNDNFNPYGSHQIDSEQLNGQREYGSQQQMSSVAFDNQNGHEKRPKIYESPFSALGGYNKIASNPYNPQNQQPDHSLNSNTTRYHHPSHQQRANTAAPPYSNSFNSKRTSTDNRFNINGYNYRSQHPSPYHGQPHYSTNEEVNRGNQNYNPDSQQSPSDLRQISINPYPGQVRDMDEIADTTTHKANRYNKMKSLLEDIEKDLLVNQEEPVMRQYQSEMESPNSQRESNIQIPAAWTNGYVEASTRGQVEYISEEEEERKPSFWSSLGSKMKNTYNAAKNTTSKIISDINKKDESSEEIIREYQGSGLHPYQSRQEYVTIPASWVNSYPEVSTKHHEYISDEEEDTKPSFWSNLGSNLKNAYSSAKNKTSEVVSNIKGKLTSR